MANWIVGGIILLLAALACRFLPDLMRLVDGIISMTAPN